MTELSKIKDKYDVIIIGAGIGGLVCGCYLAKAGMKVLIVEQHNKVGGYCSSFKRDGFTFDSTTHYLGSCRSHGQLGIIIRELNLANKIKMIRINPSDIIITSDYKIAFYNDTNETINKLQEIFPQERKIRTFFNFLTQEDYISLYASLRKYNTFSDILDNYFNDQKLKFIFGTLLSNIGLMANNASAVASATLFREFILDGGYYPKGGMQNFADALAERFKEFGGQLILSQLVEEIVIQNDKVKGIVLKNKNSFFAKNIVSDCDARQTFLKLIGKEYLDKKFVEVLTKMVPTKSAFIVYLGTNKKLDNNLICGGLWYSPHYNISEKDIDITSNNNLIGPVFCVMASLYEGSFAPKNHESIRLTNLASFKNKKYWEENKFKLADVLIRRIQKIIPNITKHIVVKEIATPWTLYRYTLNYKGAISGWVSIPSQYEQNDYSRFLNIKGLFLTGHWERLPIGQGGIPMVASLGRRVSKSIFKKAYTK